MIYILISIALVMIANAYSMFDGDETKKEVTKINNIEIEQIAHKQVLLDFDNLNFVKVCRAQQVDGPIQSLLIGITFFVVFFSNYNLAAQDVGAEVHYLGNEGLMIESEQSKILFDPFFNKNYQRFTLVPEEIRTKIFSNNKPYDNVDIIFISHAHADHFSAKDVATYLSKYSKVILVAPKQVIEKLKPLSGYQAIANQMHGISMKIGDQPKELFIEGIHVEVVRIPHVGWPEKADVENLVYRLTLHDEVTVMHMGDADIKSEHYQPYIKFWSKKVTHHAFIPHVFAMTSDSKQIVRDLLNIKEVTYIHVPSESPQNLKQSMDDFFSIPGEIRKIAPNKM